MSLFAEVERALRQRRDAPVIEWQGRSFCGNDILLGVEEAAGGLVAAGVKHGDRVLVQVEKSLQAALLYLATLRQGAIFVPLNTGYRAKEFAHFLDDAAPSLIICDPADEAEYAPLAEAGGARLLTLDHEGEGGFTQCARDSRGNVVAAAIDADDLAAIIYTSGTTGRSKGAMLSHGNLLSNARALGEIWQMSDADVLIHSLPLFHIHGLFISLNTALLAGTQVRLLPRFDVEMVLGAFPGATIFMGVPTYYVRLLADPRFDRSQAEGLRLWISGSAPLLMETFDAFEARTGQVILERYGMSECGIIASNLPGTGIRRGAVGLPLPGVGIRVADEDGSALPVDAVGSVEVRGPGVFRGYWQMPEKTAAEFRADGYFITGDLGRLDGEGYLHLVGRAKDMVITGGLNVYPSEIEAVIDALPEVEESAVIGVPHLDFGEAVVAVLCLRPGQSSDPEVMIHTLKGELAGFKVPKAILFVDNLPRNTMGKVEKAVLRAAYARLFSTEAA